jgi:ATP-dependent DNA helicase DinG
MCEAVAAALANRTHLVVEAPTGIGKSFAVAAAVADWLRVNRPSPAPPDGKPSSFDPDEDDRPGDRAAANGDANHGNATDGDAADGDAADEGQRRVVIATATKALQDQLVDEDLPRVAAVAADAGAAFTFSVLKGRSNYLCLARTAEVATSILEADRDLATGLEARATELGDGERSRLGDIDDTTWRMLSVGSDECPGARDCSFGGPCWAEAARRRSATSDVVVVNTALYAAHLLSGGNVLVDHDAVVIDEAHALADILVDAATVVVTPGRLRALERTARAWAGGGAGERLLRAADGLRVALDGVTSELDPTGSGPTGNGTGGKGPGGNGGNDLSVHLADARGAAGDIARAATAAANEGSKGADATADAALRAASTAGRLAEDLGVLLEGDDRDRVVWADGDGRLQCAPVEAAELGRDLLWADRTVVCTSATLRGAERDGRPGFGPVLAALGAPSRTCTLAVDSPFDHRALGYLYVPKGRIPSPRQDGWADGVVDELWHLAKAAGGRTLALFTSRRATEAAAEALTKRAVGTPIEVLTQWDAPRHVLVAAMRHRRTVIICATRSFWTGIDIPGDTCVVVAIDRLPFPRPDDPLMAARRRKAEERGEDPFLAVDVPAAATQLAQGVGRLIRSGTDRGVVAVLDTRLATARWRHHLLAALPGLRRSIDPDEVAEALAGM